jgi:hypothetical protein
LIVKVVVARLGSNNRLQSNSMAATCLSRPYLGLGSKNYPPHDHRRDSNETTIMSVLADIYISPDDEAVKYDTAPDQFTDRAQYKGMTPLELSMLWCIMRDIEWDAASMDEFACLLQIDGGERLIHKFPEAMVAGLSKLSPERTGAVTVAWAATEELNCSPEDIRPTVDDMVRLAGRAIETGRSMFLWNCV